MAGHREDWANGRRAPGLLDRYASAVGFDGWTLPIACPPDYVPLPVSPAETRLLASDWRRFGAIDPCEVPGPIG